MSPASHNIIAMGQLAMPQGQPVQQPTAPVHQPAPVQPIQFVAPQGNNGGPRVRGFVA
ncbi:hypothetical protein MD484_g1620, partial [Candolleomyces efflorescens]